MVIWIEKLEVWEQLLLDNVQDIVLCFKIILLHTSILKG